MHHQLCSGRACGSTYPSRCRICTRHDWSRYLHVVTSNEDTGERINARGTMIGKQQCSKEQAHHSHVDLGYYRVGTCFLGEPFSLFTSFFHLGRLYSARIKFANVGSSIPVTSSCRHLCFYYEEKSRRRRASIGSANGIRRVCAINVDKAG
jgi:hypothetical protein